jgi:hypothetical protein
MDAGITQMPRYRIIQTGKKMILECSQYMNHYSMFWYQQDPGQGLRLIHYSGSVGNTAEGDVAEGYSVSRNTKDCFPLILEPTTLSQTSMYLCSSSDHSTAQPTALCIKRIATGLRQTCLPEPLSQPREKAAFSEVLPRIPRSEISAEGTLFFMILRMR